MTLSVPELVIGVLGCVWAGVILGVLLLGPGPTTPPRRPGGTSDLSSREARRALRKTHNDPPWW